MKSKRRTVNSDADICNKKIVTRNMQNKIVDDKNVSVMTICDNHVKAKPSPNTRAKSSSAGKLDSDPYSFSKIDGDCKLPVKKMKMTEKNGKDVSVNTCNFSTMTDPELLGPCEPGTSIELQGIVWLETDTGLLVINVTWRGRTYVGTLLDSTKYQFTPPLSSNDFPGKFESRPNSRPNRGKRRCVPSGTNFNPGPRSNHIRHSRRLSESLLYSSNSKKTASRLTINGACYVDSHSLSAEASNSGESDLESNNYQKYSLGSKTRSVTRSLAKQNKVITSDNNDFNSVDTELSSNLEKCSQLNCFKQFSDSTALRYHLQRGHGVFEEIIKTETVDDGCKVDLCRDLIKMECADKDPDKMTPSAEVVHSHSTLNNVKTKGNFDFNSDSETEKSDDKRDCTNSNTNSTVKEEDDIVANCFSISSENVCSQLLGLSVNVSIGDEYGSESLRESIREDVEDSADKVSLNAGGHSPALDSCVMDTVVSTSGTDSIIVSGIPSSLSNAIIRTVTAPTVSVPFESTTSSSCSGLISSSSISPADNKVKPSQLPINIPQSRKLKSSKKSIHHAESFQIPSSATVSKKRQLIPLKVSINQCVTSSQGRIITSPTTVSVVSPSQIRSSAFQNVTPILPATSSFNHLTSIISNATSSAGSGSSNGSVCSSLHTSQCSSKRALLAPNNVSPVAVPNLFSLKPIQPKPKCSTTVTTHSNATSSIFMSQLPPTNLSGIPPSQTSYQRQILPSPVSRTENGNHFDERLLHKVDGIKSATLKKKRRKPDKKLGLNFLDSSRHKKSPLNPIQPKQNPDHSGLALCSSDFASSVDNYKMDDENSPEYSDLSETNDTPAPILEKEVELKSSDGDKLVICTDCEPTNVNRVTSFCSDSYDDTKDNSLYNKPPALMPAVLSSDLLNGSKNDVGRADSPLKTGRKKSQVTKKTSTLKDLSKGSISNQPVFEADLSVPPKHNNNTVTSSRKSFQSSSSEELTSQQSFPSKVLLYSSSQHDPLDIEKNSKLKQLSTKCSNLSAINDYVWMTKNSGETKSRPLGRSSADSRVSKSSQGENSGKKKIAFTQSPPTNGKFSVQALTSSQQDIASRSFTTPSTVISVNPNTRLTNTVFKN